jgi:hypothetical protein
MAQDSNPYIFLFIQPIHFSLIQINITASETNIRATKLTPVTCNQPEGVYLPTGRAVAQVVSPWPPAAAARVGPWVKSCGICGGQSGTRIGFIRVHRFPLPLIHSTNCPTVITIYHPELVHEANKWLQ